MKNPSPCYFVVFRNTIMGVSMFLSACGRAPEERKSPPPPAVEVERLTPGTLEEILPRTGQVEALRRQVIASPAEGPLEALNVREGDAVESGQVLARVGRSDIAEAALRSAEAEWQRASMDFDRVNRLVEAGVSTEERLEQVQAVKERAASALEQARRAVADHELRAPEAGVVSRVLLRPGHYVMPRAPVLEVVDPDHLTLRFDLPERWAGHLRVGDEVRIHLDMLGGDELRLPVSRLHPQLDPRLRTRTVEVDVPSANNALLPGAFARVEVRLARHEDVLTVPVEAVQSFRDGSLRVWRLEAEGKVAPVPVHILAESDNRVALRGELREGDRIVVAGMGMLREGMKVRTGEKP